MKNRILIALLIAVSAINAQTFFDKSADLMISGSQEIRLNDQNKTVSFIKLRSNFLVSVSDQKNWLVKSLKLSEKFALKQNKVENDLIGFTHYRYKVSYKNIPVEGSVYYVHTQNSSVISANGELQKIDDLEINPSISERDAYSKAIRYFSAEKYMWEKDINYAKPIGELVILPVKGINFLTYKFDIYSIVPFKREYVYVDANTGQIKLTINRIQTTDVTGTAVTKYNGTRQITTDSYGGSYRLREAGRGLGIETYDCNNSTSTYSAVDFVDSDNNWNTTTNQDDAANDAHFGTEATYDYFFTKFGRSSFDGSGAKLLSYVHYDYYFVNAFWDGQAMHYGDGDGSGYTALTSLDIVAHEITHAFTEHTAGLIYSSESGALNESFSDIFGITLDYYKNPTTANFLCADQISVSGTPFRSLSDPNLYGDPDTYQGQFWDPYEEVHQNSGVGNFWYYLLVSGGTGTNDIGSTYSVTGIGFDKAAQIAFRNLSVYLTPGSNYTAARQYSIQAAVDLYGACSAEVIAVTNAWFAVGVGGAFSNAVIADFNSNQTFSCIAPATVTFTNYCFNTSNYLWNFGDGGTSTVANPVHVYNAVGTYSVKLISTGTATCGNSDTMIKTNFITVTNTGGPIAAYCTPSTVNSSGQYGITNFVFNTINNTTDGSFDGYKSYTCTNSTTVTEGISYNFSVTKSYYGTSLVKIWLDVNNDGQFNNTNELLYTNNLAPQTVIGNIIIPGGAVKNTPLRLRVATDMSGNYLSTSCTNSQYGQYEDYAMIILQNTTAPSANFIASTTTANIGQTVIFSDQSLNVPTSWAWKFTGGLPATSTLQNPSVVYNSIGNYSVELKVTNAYGVDSIIKTNYIHAVNFYNMCSSTTISSSANGILYDSGGPTGNYQNYENCSFLIDLGCATNITLSFNFFQTESYYDYLSIYDGPNTSSPLLLNVAGSTIPSNVIAHSGKMYFQFHSDGSSTYSGFEANWTAVIPSGAPPNGDFSIVTTNPPLNSPVQFTDLSTNVPNSWLWYFDDGTSSNLQNPVHNFLSSGTKNVTLYVYNCYSVDTVVKTLIVQSAPSASISPSFFSVTVPSCNGTTTSNISMKNNGNGSLVWNSEPPIVNRTDDFDPIIDNSLWQNISLANIGNNCGSVSGNALYFDGDGTRQIVSYPFNTIVGGSVSFSLMISDGSLGYSCENADLGEDVTLSYSINGGISWVIIRTYNVDSFPNFTLINQVIPTAAKTSSTQFKWEQPSHSGSGCDNWAIDNVSITVGSNSFYSLTPDSGVVTSGNSSSVSVSFNASGLANGTYIQNITIFTNDPANPQVIIPCTLLVAGNPAISLSDNTLNYGTVMQTLTKTDTLFFYNTGCDTLHVTNIISSNTVFSVSSNHINVPPYDTAQIIVSFHPTTIATFQESLQIFNDDINKTVYLNAISVGAPIIHVNPSLFNVTINSCNDSITVPMTISNTGSGPLNYQLSGSGTSNGPVEVLALTYGVDMYGEYANTLLAINQYFTNYHLTEIYTTSALVLQNALAGKKVFLVAEQNYGNGSVFSGFASVLQSFVNNGGTVIFCASADDGSIFNAGLLSGNYLSYTSGGSTLNVTNTSHPLMQQIPATINAQNATVFCNFTNTDAVKLVKYNSYDVVVYRPVGAGKVIYIGFDYYSYDNNSAHIIANAVQWGGNGSNISWMHLSNTTGTVNAGSSTVVNITFSSANLLSGTFTSTFAVNSNDPLNSVINVPCTLTVTGSPSISLSATTLDFSTVLENTSKSDTLYIYNQGCATLHVNNITSSNSVFTYSPAALNVLPHDTGIIIVTFHPTSIGSFTANLIIANDAANKTVLLKGISTGAPVFSVNPAAFFTTINSCNNTVTLPLTINNSGHGPLSYQVEEIGSTYSPIEVLVLTYGVNITTQYPNMIAALNQYFSNYHLTEINTTVSTALQTALIGKKVLLIPQLQSASSSVFSGFASMLQTYVNNGGTVIFCAAYSGTSSCIFNTGLFSGSYYGSLYSGNLSVLNSTSPITLQLPSTIVATSGTYCNFTNTNMTRLVRYNNYDVVCYRQLGAGKVIYVGFDYSTYDNNTSKIIANAVRWGGNGSKTPWLHVSNTTGTVDSLHSSIINVSFVSTGLLSGTYNSNIIISSNDQVHPFITIPCSIEINGTSAMAVIDSVFNFGNVPQNSFKKDTIFIRNTGCNTLHISNISSSNSSFTISPNYLNVLPYDTGIAIITYHPVVIGSNTGTIQIIGDASVKTVSISGNCTVAPIVNINPASLYATINSCNDSVTMPLHISNSGNGVLSYQLQNIGINSLPIEVLALTYGVNLQIQYANTISAINQYYTNYNLTEINTTIPSVLQNALVGKKVFLIAQLQTGMPSVFTDFAIILQDFVNNGGTVIFCAASSSNSACIFNTGLLSGSYASSTSSGSLNVLNTTHPITSQMPTTIAAQNNTYYCNFTNSDITSLIEYNSYDVVDFRQVGAGKVIYIGFDYTTYNNYTAKIIANSIQWGGLENQVSWIHPSVTSGTVAAGSTSTVNVKLNSSGLIAGTYTSSFTVVHNDPTHSDYIIPCTIHVIGLPHVDLSEDTLNFGTIMQNTSKNDTAFIYNSGCKTLHITNITLSNSEFSVNQSYLNILPHETGFIVVSFHPVNIGSYTGNMSIISDAVNKTIILRGGSAVAPVVTINPNSYNVTLQSCGSVTTLPLNISNTGGSDLTFSINSGQLEILAFTYNVDLSGEYASTLQAINTYYPNYHLTEINTTSASTLQAALSGKKIFLVAEQNYGSSSVFLGFASVLQTFVNNGGTVIFCAASSDESIFNSGLLSGYYYGSLSGNTPLNVTNTAHPLMQSVPAAIYSQYSTVYCNITNTDAVKLVKYSSYDVVVYRQIGAGKVIYIGFDYSTNEVNSSRIIANAVQWGGNGSYLPDWITVSQSSGVLSSGISVVDNISFNSVGLSGGEYISSINMNTNDPLRSIVSIPCTLHVSYNPCVNFGYSVSCNGNTAFSDSTTNNPISWSWSFGDGSSSTLKNPTHLYSIAGTYNVRLIVCNASTCDTLIKSIAIMMNGPIPASCTPVTTMYCCGMGILNVSFNTINNTTSGGIDGYKDYSCNNITTVLPNHSYVLHVQTGTGYLENVGAWIDYNNNGQFEISEKVMTSTGNNLHYLNVIIPTTTVKNVALRLRIGSDYYSYAAPSSCSNVQNGQFEDYGVIVSGFYSVSGTLIYNSITDTTISGVTVSLKNGSSIVASTTTNSSGFYSFNNIDNGTYSFELTTSRPWGGVTATDALKIKRHVVGLELFTEPIRLSAADVNYSGFINSTDALKVQRRIVGLDASFTRPDWNFEKPITGGNNITINGNNAYQNLFALCTGDVNGTYIPSSGMKSKNVLLERNGVVLSEKGNELIIPITVNNALELGAFQLFLSFPSELEFIKISSTFQNEDFVYNIIGNEIKVVWSSLVPMNLKEGDILFAIKFRAKQTTLPDLETELNLVTGSEFADAFGNIINRVELLSPIAVISELNYVTSIQNGEFSLNNFPNPFNGKVNIEYQLPADGKVVLSVHDVLGKEIKILIQTEEKRGSHTVLFNTGSLNKGVYTLKLNFNSTQILVRKMVKY